MPTKVLFFASLVDLVGRDEATLELTEEVSVAELLDRLERQFPELKKFERRFRVALNQNFVDNDGSVSPGDEVALIPPVSGGSSPHVRAAIKSEPLDTTALTREVMNTACGAVVSFLGTVRDLTGDQITDKLHYTAYESMAQKELLDICRQACRRWALGGAVVEHRVGQLEPGEIAVVACCSAPHRAEAFEAARFLIDATKERVPLWKKEFGPDGTAWLEGDARVPSPADGE
jgi:MoaE-MoaD fusion protein